MRLILLLIGIFAAFSGVTIFLHRLFRKIVFIKYLPGLLLLLAGIYFFYMSRMAGEGFRDLAFLIMAFMAMAGFAGGIVTSIFIDAILPVIRSTKEM